MSQTALFSILAPALAGGLCLLILVIFVGILMPGRLASFGLPKARPGVFSRPLLAVMTAFAGLISAAAIVQPFFAAFSGAALLAASVVIVSLGTSSNKLARFGLPLLLAAGATGLVALQPLGLRVMMLPKADALPLALAPAETIANYEPGSMIEGLAFDKSGNLFISKMTGVNLLTGDKSQASSQIIKRSPSGEESVFFTMPPATVAGALAIAEDGTIYMTADGEGRGLWRFVPNASGELLMQAAPDSWPNGIAIGPDKAVYIADSALGIIWRVDPASPKPTEALNHNLLRPRRFVALAPGVNGLKFIGQDLFMTVSDRALVLKATLQPNKTLSEPKIVVSRVPGDDFSVAANGDIYVTTHPYNTVVRITPAGEREIVADATTGVIGPATAAFGVEPGDEHNLYIGTDGGAFEGKSGASATLVRISLK
jgi:sugar lactone lactonase YvrE